MKKFYTTLLLLTLIGKPLTASFQDDFDARVKALGPGCHYGYVIEKDGKIYEHNADLYFTPASTVKLLTAIVALKELGPEHRFVTRLGKVPLDQNYYLEFNGDPEFTSENLTELFTKLGIKRINGEVLWEDTTFSLPTTYEGWSVGDINTCEITPIRKTVINKNYIHYELRPGKSPGMHTEFVPIGLHILDYRLKDHTKTVPSGKGGRRKYFMHNNLMHIHGDIAVDSKPQKIEFPVFDFQDFAMWHIQKAASKAGVKLYQNPREIIPQRVNSAVEHRSRPLRESIPEALRTSDNTYFSTLLAYMCEEKAPEVKRWRDAGEFLKKAISKHYGVDLGGAVLDDGCGLSRYQSITPKQLYTALQAAYKDPEVRDLLIDFKRGTLTGVSCSAGRNKDGVFVMMFNNFPGKSSPYLKLQRTIVQ